VQTPLEKHYETKAFSQNSVTTQNTELFENIETNLCLQVTLIYENSAAIDVFMQVTVVGTPPDEINWASVATSAIIGAVTGGLGAATSAVSKTAIAGVKSSVARFFAQGGVHIASGLVGGSATYFIGAAIRGEEITFEDALKSMALGAATGAIMFLGSKVVGAIAGKINSLSTITAILSGSLTGFEVYVLASLMSGQPLTWEGALLSAAMGAATATIALVGGRVVGKMQNNRILKGQYREYAKGENKEFKSYSAFKKEYGLAGAGKHWHHIVEQNTVKKGIFKPEQVYNTKNTIALDASTHAKVTRIYNSKNHYYGGSPKMLVRDYVQTLSYDEQYKFGLKVLKDVGVILP
jgi:hypothetical protein